MRIMQVILGFNESAGGPVRSTAGLTKHLSEIPGCDVAVFAHSPVGIETADLGKANVFVGDWKEIGLDSKGPFVAALEKFKPDVVHVHGIWHPALHRDCVLCRKYCVPYVVAPRGSLDAWSMSQKSLKKHLALWLYQLKDLKKSAFMHVTAEMEAEHCRKVGYNGRFVISPNGLNFPNMLPRRESRKNRYRTMLFLSRIHPKKGLIELIRAWAETQHDGWRLQIVGNDSENYWPNVQREIEVLHVADSVLRTSFQSDENKWTTYVNADCFILPTHTENFGIVIAEAAYAGLPVITTTNAPWHELAEFRVGWWIDLAHKDLVRAMDEAMKLTDGEREKMGRAGHELVVERYSWDSVLRPLVGAYKELTNE